MGADGLNPFKDKKAWPNPFFIWGTPIFVKTTVVAGVAASVMLTLGKFQRACAIYLWFLLSCLFTANPLTANPSLGYVGLILLLITIIPKGVQYLPRMIPLCAWVLLAAGYTFSGLYKLGSPSWLDGSAMEHLLTNPLARPGVVRDIMLGLPSSVLQLMTWGTLALEVFFLPLAVFRMTRPYIWTSMLLMHLGIMLSVDFADLSMGMVMIHLFTFQCQWLSPRKTKMTTQNVNILFMDGECLFCQNSVKYLYLLDQQKQLHFSTLQGKAASVLPGDWRVTEDSNGKAAGNVALIENFNKENEKHWRGADAILRSLYLVGGVWKVMWIFHQTPEFIKTFGYQLIAKNRHRFSGGKKACELPSANFASRFIE